MIKSYLSKSLLKKIQQYFISNEKQLFVLICCILIAVFFRGYMDYGLHFDKANRLNNIIPLINPKAYPVNQSIFSISIFGKEIPLMYKQYISSVSGLSSMYLPLYFFDNYLFGLKFLDLLYFILTIYFSYKLARKYTSFAFIFGLMLLASPVLYPKILMDFTNNIHVILFLFAAHLLYLFYSKKQASKRLLFGGALILFFSCNLFFYNTWILTSIIVIVLLFFRKQLMASLSNLKELLIILLAFFIGMFNYIVYNVSMGFPSVSVFILRLFSREKYNEHPIDAVQAKPLLEDISYRFTHVIPNLLGRNHRLYFFFVLFFILAYVTMLIVLIKKKTLMKFRYYFIPIIGFIVTLALISISPKAFRADHFTRLSPFWELSIISLSILYIKVFSLKWVKPLVLTILLMFIGLNISMSYSKIKPSRVNKGNHVFTPAIYDLNNYILVNNIDFKNIYFTEWGICAQLYFLNKGEVIINDRNGQFRYKSEPELSEALNREIASFINSHPDLSEIYFPVLSKKDVYVMEALLKVLKSMGLRVQKQKTFYEHNGSEIIYLYKAIDINGDHFNWEDYILKKAESSIKEKPLPLNSFVNYQISGYPMAFGIYPLERGYCWFSQNARLLLKAENKNKFVISYFIPNINKYSKPLYLYVFFENEMVLKKKINQSGSFKETIAVPERYQKDRIVVYVKTSALLKAPGDSRNLGIPVRAIGFQ